MTREAPHITGLEMSRALTTREALQITVALWGWLERAPRRLYGKYANSLVREAEGIKREWPGWSNYWRMLNSCPCCELVAGECYRCPIRWRFGLECHADNAEYARWAVAVAKNDITAARKFARQIKRKAQIALERLGDDE